LAAISAGSVLAQPAAGLGGSKLTTLWFLSVADGAQPNGTLIQDASGALYGTALNGGASGLGSVFQLSPPAGGSTGWTLNVLPSFAVGSDGATTLGPLVFEKLGALYGTTVNGDASGSGPVFRLAPPAAGGGAWAYSVIYSFTGSFTGGGDGSSPFAGLVFDTSGSLYGTTSAGGAGGYGTVFTLTPTSPAGGPWVETVLYNFNGAGGAVSFAPVLFDAAGTLYGATSEGGDYNLGRVFQLKPPASPGGGWRESVLHSFGSGADGRGPFDGLTMDHGCLYGSTFDGG
jgi:uncharacterized repeat protein (TIGR03803 family)